MTESERKNLYAAVNYDRVAVFVPKGRRKAISDRARMRKMSVNSYVVGLIKDDLRMPEREWETRQKRGGVADGGGSPGGRSPGDGDGEPGRTP